MESYTTRRHALLASNSKHHGDNKREVNIIPTGIDIERFKNSNFDSKEINDLKNELGIKKE